MPINLSIIKNPANWLIVWLAALIGGFALHAFVKNTSSDQQ